MTDTTRPIVVGMMQTPPFTHMFDVLRRVFCTRLMSLLVLYPHEAIKR